MNIKLLRLATVFALVAYVSCVDLKPLCENDVFVYKGVTVNSINKTKYERKLGRLGLYYLEDMDYDSYLKSDKSKAKMSEIQQLYNEQISKLIDNSLFEEYFSSIIEISPKIESLYNDAFELRNDSTSSNQFDKLVVKPVKNGMELSKALLSNYYHKLYFTQDSHADLFESLFYQLEIEDNQIAGLQNDLITQIHNDGILEHPHFVFDKYSERLDMATTVTLVTNLVLPYYDPNYKNVEDCINANDLPSFFK